MDPFFDYWVVVGFNRGSSEYTFVSASTVLTLTPVRTTGHNEAAVLDVIPAPSSADEGYINNLPVVHKHFAVTVVPFPRCPDPRGVACPVVLSPNGRSQGVTPSLSPMARKERSKWADPLCLRLSPPDTAPWTGPGPGALLGP